MNEETKICKCIVPIHRAELGTDLLNRRILHLCIVADEERKFNTYGKKNVVPSTFIPTLADGMYVKNLFNLWFIQMTFESEAKACFAREKIEKSRDRSIEEKLSKLNRMISEEKVELDGGETKTNEGEGTTNALSDT